MTWNSESISQAFVADVAGNIGFSDSDPDNPYFINDLGQEDSRERIKPNVLGYYSAHIIGLDEKDPEIVTTRSATGYYGWGSNDRPIPDRRGVMLVFDGPISPSSVFAQYFLRRVGRWLRRGDSGRHRLRATRLLKAEP